MTGGFEDAPQKPHYAGHRKRLRERFIVGGADGLPDYELLELVLFRALPQLDVKPIAKALISKFGSFADVISAPPERLREVEFVKDAAITEIKLVQAAALRLTKQRVMKKPMLASWSALIEYIRAAMAYETREQFRILFLDRKNVLIADEVQQQGTVDHTPVYPREVVKRALELNASAVILVHNHPSGDPTPSQADISVTLQVQDAANALGIVLHDHLIIGKSQQLSFKAEGYL